MLRTALSTFATLALAGMLRDPGCGSADDREATLNAPCTRARDCADGLTCLEGVCTPVDAGTGDGAPADAATD